MTTRRLSPRSRTGGAALASGLLSVLALPVAVLVTRWTDRFGLPAAGVAVPIAVVCGTWAAVTRPGAARSRLLGRLGLCMGAAGAIALVTLLVLRLLED